MFPFGCRTIVYINKKDQEKYLSKSKEGVLVGVNLNRQEWIVLINKQYLFSTRNAKFYLTEFPENSKITNLQEINNYKTL